ncbi:MAG: DUF928 domain-containing protein [Thermosynechococcaceae cyanobacterium]
MTNARLSLLILGSTLLVISSAPRTIYAQQTALNRTTKLRLVLPKPPNDPGAPKGRRKGGSSRGGELATCSGLNALASVKTEEKQLQCQPPNLTALVPVTEAGDLTPFVWGLTAAARPTLWFVTPTTESTSVEFILQDDQDRYVYRTSLTLPAQAAEGVIEFTLPASAPALQVNQRYTWTMLLEATASHPNLFVKGSLYRVPTNNVEPKQASDLEQVAMEAEQGLWHDALTRLAQLRRSNPNDLQIQAAWADLLGQVGLDAIANAPLLPCCTTDAL